MAKWQRTLRLQPEWGMALDAEMTMQQLAAVVARRLAALVPFGDGIGRTMLDFDEERAELIDEFEGLSEDADADNDDFDDVMSRLYDWGDQSMDSAWNGKKVCWIDTIGTRP